MAVFQSGERFFRDWLPSNVEREAVASLSDPLIYPKWKEPLGFVSTSRNLSLVSIGQNESYCEDRGQKITQFVFLTTDDK